MNPMNPLTGTSNVITPAPKPCLGGDNWPTNTRALQLFGLFGETLNNMHDHLTHVDVI